MPSPPRPAALTVTGGEGGRQNVGRPTRFDSRARTREFIRRLSAGETFVQAREGSGVKADRVLRLLDESEFAAVVGSILRERSSSAVFGGGLAMMPPLADVA